MSGECNAPGWVQGLTLGWTVMLIVWNFTLLYWCREQDRRLDELERKPSPPLTRRLR